jgi:hypothetical protein
MSELCQHEWLPIENGKREKCRKCEEIREAVKK